VGRGEESDAIRFLAGRLEKRGRSPLQITAPVEALEGYWRHTFGMCHYTWPQSSIRPSIDLAQRGNEGCAGRRITVLLPTRVTPPQSAGTPTGRDAGAVVFSHALSRIFIRPHHILCRLVCLLTSGRASSPPIGPGVCKIPDMTFAELTFHALR
jgi:hypothetical protein